MACNVAGIGGFANSHEVDPGAFAKMIAVNLTGTFFVCRAVLPQMVERGEGVIVNTASTAGIMGQPWSAGYCASKGGVHMLTKALATEYDTPIRINAVAPGGVATAMYTAFVPPEGVDWNRMKKMSRDNVDPVLARGDRQPLRLPRLRRGPVHDRVGRGHGRRHHRLTPSFPARRDRRPPARGAGPSPGRRAPVPPDEETPCR